MSAINKSLSWSEIGTQIDPWIQDAIILLGFPTMTPVQAATVPLFCGNKDVVVQAVTGSGKTLAFVIPILQKLTLKLKEDGSLPRGSFFGVIVSPTRELASQIERVIHSVLKFLPEEGLGPNNAKISTQLLVGSLESVRENVDKFVKTRPHILVGTPGRLLDFLGVSSIKTNACEMAVLDEADKLLDIGFEQDVVSILTKLPKQRRTGLFSATVSSAGTNIFRTGMSNPVKVAVSSSGSGQASAPKSLSIAYMMVNPEFKLLTTMNLLSNYQFKKCIVYFPTCASVKHFYNLLQHYQKTQNTESGFKLHSMHGQLSTKARLRALNSFDEGDHRYGKHILMTTDVAARGIDIPDVDLVIQLDPPTNPENFLHRCGRTGRANKVGQAIVMLSDSPELKEDGYIEFMEVKGIKMSEMEAPLVSKDSSLPREVRKYMLSDRAHHEIALKAYVGFVKYYTKHQASSIFRMAALDYLGIAKMYGLLRLPKMPETRYIKMDDMPEDGWLGEKIDMDKYAYADSKREEVRLSTLEETKAALISESKRRKELKKKNEAWSSKTENKETKQVRREKMKRKREAIEKQLDEESSDDEEAEVDWKEEVRNNKKKKQALAVEGTFDDL